MNEPSREQKLESILHAYLQAVDAGQQPDREALLGQHPDLAGELREFFGDQEKMDRFAKSMHKAQVGEATLGADELAGSADLPPRIRYFGDYELQEEIARGGMGVVFKARQVSLNRPVALKMILKGELANDADVQRFRDEAEAAANLDHPNIVPIYEIGAHEGQQYFSMKLIGPGNRRADLGVKETVRVTALVARAVHHAHQRGILHRDLKPSNILFDENGDPHVGDFGLAKRVGGDSGMTRSGAILGTPSYMAPEQARADKALTTAVDVYSLGAILFEWLTGQPPFRGSDVLGTLAMVVGNEPPRPRSLNPRVDRDLETICLKCLEKDPQRRYASAAAVAEDLDRWQRGEPILARPIRWPGRVRRWCRRKPALAGVTFLAVLSTFGALALVAYGYVAQNEAYCRSMLQTIELYRTWGRIEAARSELRESKSHFWFGLDPEWRGAALQVAATAEIRPLRQVRIGVSPKDEFGPVNNLANVGLAWEDADQIRISIDKDVQVYKVSSGELSAQKQAGDNPPRAFKLSEASPKVRKSIPKDTVMLGRSANDAWAVLRFKAKEADKERVVLWDVDRQAELYVLPDVGKIPDFVLVSPDGRRMAYADPFAPPQTLRLWDWQWNLFSLLDTGISQDLASVGGFSPDGEMLVTRGMNGGVNHLFIWQVESGRLLTRVVHANDAGWQWSPDSAKLATVSRGPDTRMSAKADPGIFLQVWEVRYPSRSCALTANTMDNVFTVAPPTFSPSGPYVAWGGQFWKIASRGDDTVLERMEHVQKRQPEQSRAQFAADGSRWLMRFSVAQGGQLVDAKRLEPDPLTRSLVLPDSKAPPGGKGECRHVDHVAMSPDGKHALLATRRIEFRPQTNPVFGNDYLLEWWDLAEGKRLSVWNESSPENNVFGIKLVADGRVALTNADSGLKLWDVASGKIKETLPASIGQAGGLCLSPDLRHWCRFTVAEMDAVTLKRSKPTVLDFYEIATGQLVQHLELRDWHGGWGSVAFHLQTGWLAASNGPYVELWNLKTGKLWARWQPHEGGVLGHVTLSHDGQILATTSGTMLRLWPVQYLEQEVEKLER
jgi:WD40 repeat protein